MNWPFDKLKANGFKLLRAESIKRIGVAYKVRTTLDSEQE
jgi:hypothetical protein